MITYSKKIGHKLRKIREIKGFSQEYVARELEISQRQYQRLESGAIEIGLNKLEQICLVFAISPERLIGFDEKLVIENCTNSGQGSGVNVHNNLPKQLLDKYEEQISLLKDELKFLRDLVNKQMD